MWENVLRIIGEVVVAVGGVSGLIIVCSGFIAKHWAEWFMEKERQKISTEIERYKNELQKEIEITRSLNEQIVHRNKVIFDSEYKYYEELVPQLVKASKSVAAYIVVLDETKKLFPQKDVFGFDLPKQKHKEAHKEVFEFYDSLIKYAVFIEKECYDQMMQFFYYCHDILKIKDQNKKEKMQRKWGNLLKECVKRENETIDVLRSKIRK